MKILVFEYITGGGMRNESLPASLSHEGDLMLCALVGDLLEVENAFLTLIRDRRLPLPAKFSRHPNLATVEIDRGDDFDSVLDALIAGHDAVWPIAPETDSILAGICEKVEKSGRRLLSPSSNAVRLTGNKLATYRCLEGYGIPAVPTFERSAEPPDFGLGEWVAKPVDGVGCEGGRLIRDAGEFGQIPLVSDYVLQPYVAGRSVSLSCLFGHGRSWLICRNEQRIDRCGRGFELKGCTVNLGLDEWDYRGLVGRVAEAVPGLWGYAGIDLIETEKEPLILEINPRLTTSYAGIRRATGLNVAAFVLGMLDGNPEITMSENRRISVDIPQDYDDAR
ncbi:MAG: ATP-grasp domain-containing protein [Gammaproteobacteria bacterium]